MQKVINVWWLAQATFFEGVRHKALWAILALAIVLSTFNIVATEIFAWDLGKVSVEFGLSAVAFTGLLVVFSLAIKILADDMEGSSIHMILSRPIAMWQYIAGKYLGLSLVLFVTTLIIGVSSAISMQYVLWQHPAYIPPNFTWLTYVMALCCQWLSLNMVLAVSFFFFSFASHHFVSLLFSVFSYLIGQNIELFRQVVVENPRAGVLAGQENIVIFISWIFPNLALFDKKSVAAYGLPFYGQEFVFLVGYSLAYSLLLLFFSTILLNRRDIV